MTQQSPSILLETKLAGIPVRRGKVRDVYDLGKNVLIVATDRVSAFDCVLPDAIPHKGRVLAGLSRFWFERLSAVCPNHFIEMIYDRMPPGFESAATQLRGRSMLCRRVDIIPIECVARGYLTGSVWSEYQKRGTACGVKLPAGLPFCSALPEPIFTPATKAESGHDENIDFEAACRLVGRDVMEELRDKTLSLYRKGAEYAKTRGILIADTKFEFGRCDGRLVLADEALTPDSSRFWPASAYAPGRDQESYDKQFIRNYLQGLCDAGRWDKTPPTPKLPPDVIEKTSAKYLDAYERITGARLEDAR